VPGEEAVTIRIPIRGNAQGALQIYAEEDWSAEDPELQAACEAARRGRFAALVFDQADSARVMDGLITLANTHDEEAEAEARKPNGDRDPERLRMLRAATAGLSTLSSKVLRSADPSSSAR
jgi:hypothetical protein